MKLHFKKALVTGGAGFIGSHIVDELLDRGIKVAVIDNLSTGNLQNLAHVQERISFFQGDIRDHDILTKAVQGSDVIFHLAAVVSVTQTVEQPIDSAMVNDLGTLSILEVARQHDVKKVIISSSCAVYGDSPKLPKIETMIPLPLSPYAVQKLTGELNAKVYNDLYGLKTVCLRYFNVYGPRQDPSSPYSGVISIFMSKAASKDTPVIYGDGNQYRDFIFVKDVVRANLLSAIDDKACGKVFNIGSAKNTTINQLWKMICTMTALKIKPEYRPERSGDIRESFADIKRAQSILGFLPEYSFEKGLEITLQHAMV
ncbi:SDR family oxidoreductase [Desulfococcaceae bacterium HSG9]|nr:SDR family oxidoreductase [Desulfococcaceae bacterium HSG9]